MRVILVSTHVDHTTGYSKVAYNLVNQIATLNPAVKLFHYGFQRHGGRVNLRRVPKGVIAYDAAAGEDPVEEGFGYKQLRDYIDTVNPKLVIFYNDPLVVARFLDAIQYSREKDSFKVWTYLDQLYMGISHQLMNIVDNASEHVYTFTPRWKAVYESYFPGGPKAKVKVMGHAADPDVFKPLPQRLAGRADMRIPEDGIVFLNCNRNTERKRLDLTIQGFVRLIAENPDKPYYLVIATTTDPRTGAFYDIRNIFMSEIALYKLNIIDVGERVILIDTGTQIVYGDDAINRIYNACDIGINTSDGEGYGLCQLEHLQTGAPQIVTTVGSYEFLEGCAVRIEAPHRMYHSQTMPLGLFGQVTTADEVFRGMKEAIEKLPVLRDAISKKAFPSWSGVCEEFLEDLLELSRASL